MLPKIKELEENIEETPEDEIMDQKKPEENPELSFLNFNFKIIPDNIVKAFQDLVSSEKKHVSYFLENLN